MSNPDVRTKRTMVRICSKMILTTSFATRYKKLGKKRESEGILVLVCTYKKFMSTNPSKSGKVGSLKQGLSELPHRVECGWSPLV